MLDLVVASILFSLSFGLIKAEVSALDPFFVAFVRLGLSFLAFAPLLRRTRGRTIVHLAAIGFVQFGVMYCLYIASFRVLAGYQVAMLTTATPIYVIALDAFFERRLGARALLAGLLAIASGVALVFDPRAVSVSAASFATIQAANLCFALGQVLYRRLFRRGVGLRDESAFGWLYLGGLLAPALALVLLGSPGQLEGMLPTTPRAWLSLAYLGLVPSALGFFLWNRGATRVGAATVGVLNNLKAPLGVLLAWLLFGESLDPWRLGASAGLMFAALRAAPRG